MTKTAPEGFSALKRGFRHKVFYSFRDGASTRRCGRKYSLTQKVVEEIIREHMAKTVIGLRQNPSKHWGL